MSAGTLWMRPIGQGHELIAIREATFKRDGDHIRAIVRQHTRVLRIISKRTITARLMSPYLEPHLLRMRERHLALLFRVAIKRTLLAERHARDMELGR